MLKDTRGTIIKKECVASRAEVKQFVLASNAIVLLPALRLLGTQPPIPCNAEQALRL